MAAKTKRLSVREADEQARRRQRQQAERKARTEEARRARYARREQLAGAAPF